MTKERVNYCPSSHPFLLQLSKGGTKLLHLTSTGTGTHPSRLCFRSPGSALWQRGLEVSDIKPVTLPLDSLTRGLVEKVLSLIFWAKHQLSTTHFGRLAGARDWAKIEEMLKEMKMWLDTKESLAQMSEDSKMKNGLRG